MVKSYGAPAARLPVGRCLHAPGEKRGWAGLGQTMGGG